MDYRRLFSEVRDRPGLYGLDGSFRGFCAFVHGADAGNDWQLLAGFRESLVVRVGAGNNLTWPALVLRLAWPDVDTGWLELVTQPDRNRTAVDALFSLLEEYLDRRAVADGLVTIFDEYLTWLKAQDWYR